MGGNDYRREPIRKPDLPDEVGIDEGADNATTPNQWYSVYVRKVPGPFRPTNPTHPARTSMDRD
jgi:hypothetical protein